MNQTEISKPLLERFTRYAAIGSQSNMEKADAGILPSTDCQKDMARLLVAELKGIGLADVSLDENFYILARIPASPGLEGKPSFGLCAHMDTASDAPGDNVHPRVHTGWDGKPIMLVAGCVGDTIITSDGTTLLGADDKAGVAGIITLADHLLKHPEIQHGPIEILFSPDEETGHGMDRVPLAKLASKAFYTCDGGQQGEVETECFNAWKTELTFTGVSAHLGTARGKMVNAITMASRFVASLPAQESPEATDGYYGYFCPLELRGTTEHASVTVFIRDFDSDSMARRLERIDALAKGVEAQFPGGTVTVKRTCQYLNMKRKLDAAPHVLALLQKAAQRAGVETFMKPIRGGTDGSRLTEMGIPTPNLFTGGHNYHSRTEWASLSQMTKMVETLIELAKLWGE